MKRFFLKTSSILVLISLLIGGHSTQASAAGLTPRLSMKISEESLQTVRDFDVTLAMDKRANSIEKVDVYFSYDPEYIKVVDQNPSTPEADIGNTSTFGTLILQNVDDINGEIHVQLDSTNSNEIVDVITIPLQQYKEGKTEFTLSGKTQIFVNGVSVPYRDAKVISAQTITPTHSTRFAHVQSNFLAREDTPLTVDVYIDTPETIENIVFEYQTRPNPGDSNPFKKANMTQTDEKKFSFTIPNFDVRAPGVVYCFQANTDKTFFVLPRPCSIENAFEVFVLPDDQFDDDTPPEITITPPGGNFQNPINVTVTSSEPGKIYCTRDGTEPNRSSPLYIGGSFSFENNVTLKCIAEDLVGNLSEIRTEKYVFGGLQIQFTANPEVIAKPGNSTLSWIVSGATNIIIDQDIGSVLPTGEKVVFVPKLTTYTLTASNGSETKQAQATVRVLNSTPEIDLSASKDSIQLGERVTLTWVSQNLENEKITPSIGNVGTDENNEEQGSVDISPNQTTTYTISGFDSNGETITDSVTIIVNRTKSPGQPGTGPAQLWLWLMPVSAFVSSITLKRRQK